VPTGDPCRCRPLLVGYYGEHNLGDDALLEVLLSQLPPGCDPLVTARDGAQVANRHGVRCVDRTSFSEVLAGLSASTALVLGGGSLLQDSTSFRSLLYYAALIQAARLQAKPVLLWAQGLGPLRQRRSRLLVRLLLAQTTACSWRDAESEALARRLGWPARQAAVGSDPVWSLPAVPWCGSGGPVVLCFRPTAQLNGERWRPWLAALEQVAPDREVLWLPLHAHQDRGLLADLHRHGLLSDRLAARCRELTAEQPSDVISACSGAGLVVAMRLHGLILAALSGAPVAALSYDPKVRAAAEALGCPVHDLAANPDPIRLAADWRDNLDRPLADPRLELLRQGVKVHSQLLANHLG
jgi:polysaccharide pyruvyl transferase CsaB